MKSIIKIDEEYIKTFLSEAKYRVAYAAPGISEAIANILLIKWKNFDPNEVRIILDISSDICRLGYGTAEAVQLLDNTAKELGDGRLVCHQEGIRIGILISDSRVCFFAPTALLIESGTESSVRPNGIILEPVPSDVLKEIGLGEKREAEQAIGLDKVKSDKITEVINDIKENPPQKFDVARKVRVFNSRFEFVELKVEGCFLSRRKVTIPPKLMGLAGDEDLRNRIRSTFQLITGDELAGKETEVNENKIKKDRKTIEDCWLRNIDGYGKVVLRENKDGLNKDINDLKKLVDDYQKGLKEKLSAIIEKNAASLTEQLTPSLKSNPSPKDLGLNPTGETVKKYVYHEIMKVFGPADKYIKEMKVEVVYKNVSYELLHNEEFLAAADRAFPHIKFLHEEYDALKGLEVIPKPISIFKTPYKY